MTIYDKEAGVLYLPENGNQPYFDKDEAYRKGYGLGYADGYKQAEEDCGL